MILHQSNLPQLHGPVNQGNMRSMPLRYLTDTGIEVPAVTTEQMIEVDRVAIEDTGPNLLQMREPECPLSRVRQTFTLYTERYDMQYFRKII